MSASNRCVLGCILTAEDSEEHYACCPFTLELGRRYLRLQQRQQINMHTFLMCNPHIQTKEDLTAAAILVYAIYRATNSQRFGQPVPQMDIYRALAQWAREGVFGHAAAERVLRERWMDHPPATDLPPRPLVIAATPQGRRKRPREQTNRHARTETPRDQRRRIDPQSSSSVSQSL